MFYLILFILCWGLRGWSKIGPPSVIQVIFNLTPTLPLVMLNHFLTYPHPPHNQGLIILPIRPPRAGETNCFTKISGQWNIICFFFSIICVAALWKRQTMFSLVMFYFQKIIISLSVHREIIPKWSYLLTQEKWSYLLTQEKWSYLLIQEKWSYLLTQEKCPYSLTQEYYQQLLS